MHLAPPPFLHWHSFQSNIEEGIHIFLEEHIVSLLQVQWFDSLMDFHVPYYLGETCALVCLLAWFVWSSPSLAENSSSPTHYQLYTKCRRSYLLKVSQPPLNSTTNWGPSVHVQEPLRDISHSNHRSASLEGSEGSRPLKQLVTIHPLWKERTMKLSAISSLSDSPNPLLKEWFHLQWEDFFSPH